MEERERAHHNRRLRRKVGANGAFILSGLSRPHQHQSGVLNLLPIPMLDGGHLMYYVIEIVKGSPLSARAMEMGQQVGMGCYLP